MTAKNDITGDLIKSKPSDTYADNYDAIFRKDKQSNTEQNETKQVGAVTSLERLVKRPIVKLYNHKPPQKR